MPTPCFKAFSALSALRSQQSLDQRTITEQRQTPVWADAHTGASLCFGEIQVYGLHQLPPGLVADALEEEPFHPYTIEGQVDLFTLCPLPLFCLFGFVPGGDFHLHRAYAVSDRICLFIPCPWFDIRIDICCSIHESRTGEPKSCR